MSGHALTDWLLESPTPSLRYFTLRRLLGRAEDDPAVAEARRAIVTEGPAPAILARQTEAGNWAGEHSYYTPKYTSTHWSLTLLVELGLPPEDPRLRRGAAFMLRATAAELQKEQAAADVRWQCLWGNLLRYVGLAGLAEDPQAQAIIAYLARNAQGGEWRCPWSRGWPCPWGAARALWGLAALPAPQRTAEVQAAVRSGLSLLLDQSRLAAAEFPTEEKPHAVWGRLNFPLFYQADILFVLRVLAEHGALGHPNAQAALHWLAARRAKDGRWRGASPFRRRTWPELLPPGDDLHRWVSLHAATVLGAAG